MNDTIGMTLSSACQNVIKELFNFHGIDSFAFSKGLKVSFEVFLQVLEDKIQLFLFYDNVF